MTGKRIVSADVRLMTAADLAVADRVMRIAFGTFIGLPDPENFAGDSSYVAPRWTSRPESAFVAVVDGEIVGSNFASRWGSFGFFGPLTVRPDFWDAGIGQQLMVPVMDCFSSWGVTLSGLFTFPHSVKHIATYQKFGFRPRQLTAVMSKAPSKGKIPTRFSEMTARERAFHLEQSAILTDAGYAGLDLGFEITAVEAHKLGDTIFVTEGSRIAGFAICHHGAGSEGGSATCYAKFAAAGNRESCERLLDACEAYAAHIGVPAFVAGVSTARAEAYDILLERGYRIEMMGIAMHRPNEPGWSRPGVYVLDDWR